MTRAVPSFNKDSPLPTAERDDLHPNSFDNTIIAIGSIEIIITPKSKPALIYHAPF